MSSRKWFLGFPANEAGSTTYHIGRKDLATRDYDIVVHHHYKVARNVLAQPLKEVKIRWLLPFLHTNCTDRLALNCALSVVMRTSVLTIILGILAWNGVVLSSPPTATSTSSWHWFGLGHPSPPKSPTSQLPVHSIPPGSSRSIIDAWRMTTHGVVVVVVVVLIIICVWYKIIAST